MMTESHVSVSPMVRPNPGKVLRRPAAALTMPPAAASAKSVLVNLIENAAFAEVFLLRLGPAAEHVVDREQFDLRERVFVFLGNLGIARTIGIARGNFLTFLAVPVPQIGLGNLAGALPVCNRIDDRNGRLGEDRARRRYDLEFVLADNPLRQKRPPLPGQHAIADPAIN